MNCRCARGVSAISLCLALAAGTATAASQNGRSGPVFGPTPCLDAAFSLKDEQLFNGIMEEAIRHAGQKRNLTEAQWRKGLPEYDQALQILVADVRADPAFAALTRNVTSGQNFLAAAFSRATPEDGKFLQAFLKTPGGALFWSAAVDGVICRQMLEAQRGGSEVLTAPQEAVYKKWMATIPARETRLGDWLRHGTAQQLADYQKASGILRSLLRSQVDTDYFPALKTIQDQLFGLFDTHFGANIRRFDPLLAAAARRKPAAR